MTPAREGARFLSASSLRAAMFLFLALTALMAGVLSLGRSLPSTNRLSFVSGGDGNLDIYALDMGRNLLNDLTRDPEVDESPAWSPNGQKLAFISYRDGN